MSQGDLIRVEVCYAVPSEQVILALDVAAGSTLRDAIGKSGILQRFPEIDLARDRVGRWSQLASMEDPARDGDRIEIYRPLIADPKEARRKRAATRRK